MPIIALILFICLIGLVCAVAPVFFGLVVCYIVLKVVFSLYENFYYKSEKFNDIKNSIVNNTLKCNELNKHIENLKNAYINIEQLDYGKAIYADKSKFNYNRPELKNLKDNTNVFECSQSVCKNAQAQPFKYLIKYFNIEKNEATLENFESVLNDFSAVEEGKNLLKNERDQIIHNIENKIPFLIKKFSMKKLIEKLGFDDIDFSQYYFPKYSFRYISPGGNSKITCDIVFDIENIDRFINYLSDAIKFQKSIAGQRALMTSALREKIKTRDSHTCQYCSLSTTQEPNLLLEIDHIIPLSKGGITTEENLQTLCWRCNRTKSNKIIEPQQSLVSTFET